MRKPRIEYPGAMYHVFTRGDNKEDIYLADEDRLFYLRNLKKYKDSYSFKLFAYCLMSNHVHLVVKTDETPLSKIMHAINSNYSKYFNKEHAKVGHLFQGRYKATLIKSDAHLLEATRYVHLNPVNASITASPESYSWSSYGSYFGNGYGSLFSLVDSEDILSYFGKRQTTRAERYRIFVQEGIVLGRDKRSLRKEIALFRSTRPGN